MEINFTDYSKEALECLRKYYNNLLNNYYFSSFYFSNVYMQAVIINNLNKIGEALKEKEEAIPKKELI